MPSVRRERARTRIAGAGCWLVEAITAVKWQGTWNRALLKECNELNCFVIMPFAQGFDDVYATIKASVTKALGPEECRCFRLDEERPAGRITTRLLQELRSASLCVADIKESRPNVMWEVGYAMALEHPMIILSQTLDDLPFDIRDMQTVQYDRSRLNTTLGQPLQKIVVDSMSFRCQAQAAPVQQNDLVGQLLSEMADLKNMVAQAVRSWNPGSAPVPQPGGESLQNLEGAWVSASGTHLYGSIIESDLVVPYCYHRDDELTGAYFGWRVTGDYWFARFAWRDHGPAGFAFLRQDSVDVLRGAWWSDKRNLGFPKAPPEKEGVPATWRRARGVEFPPWATRFLKDVQKKGVSKALEGQ